MNAIQGIIRWLLLIFVVLISQSVFANRDILVINSYSHDYRWATKMVKEMMAEVHQTFPSVEFRTTYLALDHLSVTSDIPQYIPNAFPRYDENKQPLAIVLVSDEAWIAYRAKFARMFPDVPVFLSGVKTMSVDPEHYFNSENSLLDDFYPTTEEMKRYNATGVLREVNISKTIDLMKQLQPDMNSLLFIGDNRFYARYCHALLCDYVDKVGLDIPVVNLLAPLAKTDSLLSYVRKMPDDVGVLFSVWLNGENSYSYAERNIYTTLSKSLKVPIFSTADVAMDKDCFLGGYFLESTHYGEKVGAQLVDYLQGKSVQNISTEIIRAGTPLINWNVMERFGFQEDDFPQGTRFLKKPDSFGIVYERELNTLLWCLLLVIGLNLIIAFAYIRMKRINQALGKSREELMMLNEKLREVESQQAEALRVIDEANRFKDALNENVARGIKQLLVEIQSDVERLKFETDLAERERFIDSIQEKGGVLHEMVRDTLVLSQMDAGIVQLDQKELCLIKLCNRVVKSYRSQCLPGVNLQFVTLDEELQVVSDEKRLEQVLRHLVENAVRFTHEGQILLSCRKDGDCVKIEVRDTGIGIPEDAREKIFKRFVRLDKDMASTGLGLALSKMIVQNLYGRIGVESHVGKGSTFWVHLPIDREIR